MRTMVMMACCLMLAARLAFAGSAETFRQANADYEAGRHAEAAKAYEGLLKREGPRVSVLRNLGNAYFQMGENGRAILSYERALFLSPRDPGLRANLKLAQDQAAVYASNEPALWRSFLERHPARSWSVAALSAAILLPLAALAWSLTRRRARPWILAFAAADLAVLGLAITALVVASGEPRRGIIIADAATVRISPFEKADSKGTLPGGREVILGKRSNGYLWASLSDGSREGWVAEGEVEPVIPDPH